MRKEQKSKKAKKLKREEKEMKFKVKSHPCQSQFQQSSVSSFCSVDKQIDTNK